MFTLFLSRIPLSYLASPRIHPARLQLARDHLLLLRRRVARLAARFRVGDHLHPLLSRPDVCRQSVLPAAGLWRCFVFIFYSRGVSICVCLFRMFAFSAAAHER